MGVTHIVRPTYTHYHSSTPKPCHARQKSGFNKAVDKHILELAHIRITNSFYVKLAQLGMETSSVYTNPNNFLFRRRTPPRGTNVISNASN